MRRIFRGGERERRGQRRRRVGDDLIDRIGGGEIIGITRIRYRNEVAARREQGGRRADGLTGGGRIRAEGHAVGEEHHVPSGRRRQCGGEAHGISQTGGIFRGGECERRGHRREVGDHLVDRIGGGQVVGVTRIRHGDEIVAQREQGGGRAGGKTPGRRIRAERHAVGVKHHVPGGGGLQGGRKLHQLPQVGRVARGKEGEDGGRQRRIGDDLGDRSAGEQVIGVTRIRHRNGIRARWELGGGRAGGHAADRCIRAERHAVNIKHHVSGGLRRQGGRETHRVPKQRGAARGIEVERRGHRRQVGDDLVNRDAGGGIVDVTRIRNGDEIVAGRQQGGGRADGQTAGRGVRAVGHAVGRKHHVARGRSGQGGRKAHGIPRGGGIFRGIERERRELNGQAGTGGRRGRAIRNGVCTGGVIVKDVDQVVGLGRDHVLALRRQPDVRPDQQLNAVGTGDAGDGVIVVARIHDFIIGPTRRRRNIHGDVADGGGRHTNRGTGVDEGRHRRGGAVAGIDDPRRRVHVRGVIDQEIRQVVIRRVSQFHHVVQLVDVDLVDDRGVGVAEIIHVLVGGREGDELAFERGFEEPQAVRTVARADVTQIQRERRGDGLVGAHLGADQGEGDEQVVGVLNDLRLRGGDAEIIRVAITDVFNPDAQIKGNGRFNLGREGIIPIDIVLEEIIHVQYGRGLHGDGHREQRHGDLFPVQNVGEGTAHGELRGHHRRGVDGRDDGPVNVAGRTHPEHAGAVHRVQAAEGGLRNPKQAVGHVVGAVIYGDGRGEVADRAPGVVHQLQLGAERVPGDHGALVNFQFDLHKGAAHRLEGVVGGRDGRPTAAATTTATATATAAAALEAAGGTGRHHRRRRRRLRLAIRRIGIIHKDRHDGVVGLCRRINMIAQLCGDVVRHIRGGTRRNNQHRHDHAGFRPEVAQAGRQRLDGPVGVGAKIEIQALRGDQPAVGDRQVNLVGLARHRTQVNGPGIHGDHGPGHLGGEGGLQGERIMIRDDRGRHDPGVIHQVQIQEGGDGIRVVGGHQQRGAEVPMIGRGDRHRVIGGNEVAEKHHARGVGHGIRHRVAGQVIRHGDGGVGHIGIADPEISQFVLHGHQQRTFQIRDTIKVERHGRLRVGTGEFQTAGVGAQRQIGRRREGENNLVALAGGQRGNRQRRHRAQPGGGRQHHLHRAAGRAAGVGHIKVHQRLAALHHGTVQRGRDGRQLRLRRHHGGVDRNHVGRVLGRGQHEVKLVLGGVVAGGRQHQAQRRRGVAGQRAGRVDGHLHIRMRAQKRRRDPAQRHAGEVVQGDDIGYRQTGGQHRVDTARARAQAHQREGALRGGNALAGQRGGHLIGAGLGGQRHKVHGRGAVGPRRHRQAARRARAGNPNRGGGVGNHRLRRAVKRLHRQRHHAPHGIDRLAGRHARAIIEHRQRRRPAGRGAGRIADDDFILPTLAGELNIGNDQNGVGFANQGGVVQQPLVGEGRRAPHAHRKGDRAAHPHRLGLG